MHASLAFPTPCNTLGMALFFPVIIVVRVGCAVADFALKLMGRG